MHHPCCKASAITTAITITCAVDAFIVNPTTARTLLQQPSTRATRFLIRPPLHLTSSSSSSPPRPSSSQLYDTTSNADDAQDNEIVRLKKMAAKLRAEAASLEADKAKQLADVAEKAFRRFDTNVDGVVSLNELKMGLEKELKTEISENRVKELMQYFDTSGDGVLALDEFVTVDRFRNQLESFAREEKEKASKAIQEVKRQEQEALLAQAKLEFLNEKEPTTTDRVLSVLPYLFPLMDSLQYGRFLLGSDDAGANPFVIILAVLFSLYRSIPFSGFVAFFALNFLSGNPSLNRLIRFNMQQAIFLDIALIFPSLILGLGGIVTGAAGSSIASGAGEIFSDVIFGTLLLILAYCTGSSLLGKEPGSIPIISEAVKVRMPTIDMFDNDGRFVLKEKDDDKDKDKK